MNDDHEKEGGLRVVDRRRFTEEGLEREDVERSSEDRSSGMSQDSAKATPDRKPMPEDSSNTEMSFASFLVSLATQAMIMLGEIPHPDTNSPQINLEAARQTIDILTLLEEKTKGNLTVDEEKLLTEIVASLQIAYVNRLKSR